MSQTQTERILVVDEDPDILDFLARQVLQPLSYQVETAHEAGLAIQKAINFNPDLIIASLTLPGLSGKDLLVALRSQGLEIPLLVTAPEGEEASAIQAFRLGARDYLVKPMREPEVVAALERALKEVQWKRDREQLSKQLAESNQKLERRVRELTTIYGIGKAVTSITHQGRLFDKLMESSLNVTEADKGWILLQEEKGEQLVLRAQKGMPASMESKIHSPWDDGVSSLVLLSGESLIIHGEGLEQFKVARFAKAALIVPIKARDRPIGVISVVRERENPFSEANQRMLQAVADYSSISLVNSRLFQALAGRADRLQEEVTQTRTGLQDQLSWAENSSRALRAALDQITRLLRSVEDQRHRDGLHVIQRDLESLLEQLERPSATED